MRLFYYDEGPIDTLLQIAAKPVLDGDLVSKQARDKFVQLDWVARCHGWNVITSCGQKAIDALALRRVECGLQENPDNRIPRTWRPRDVRDVPTEPS